MQYSHVVLKLDADGQNYSPRYFIRSADGLKIAKKIQASKGMTRDSRWGPIPMLKFLILTAAEYDRWVEKHG